MTHSPTTLNNSRLRDFETGQFEEPPPPPPPYYTTYSDGANYAVQAASYQQNDNPPEEIPQEEFEIVQVDQKRQPDEKSITSTSPLDSIIGCVTLASLLIVIVVCSLMFLVLLLFGLIIAAVPLITIIIGSVYIDKEDCPADFIAPFLITEGVLSLVCAIFAATSQALMDSTATQSQCFRYTYFLIEGTFFGWNLALSIFIYRLALHVQFDPLTSLAANYCHPYLFYYSIVLVTVYWLFLLFSCYLQIFCGSFLTLLKDHGSGMLNLKLKLKNRDTNRDARGEDDDDQNQYAVTSSIMVIADRPGYSDDHDPLTGA